MISVKMHVSVSHKTPALRAEGSKADESRDREDKMVVCKRTYMAPGECEVQGAEESGEKILD